MSWRSRKKKEGIFLYCLFCPKEIFLTFIFYLNVQCIEYAFKIYIVLHSRKTLLHTLVLLVFKIVENFQCILNKIYRNETLSSTSHKTKSKKKRANILFNFIFITSKTREKVSQITVSFYIFYYLYSDLVEKFKNKNLSKLLVLLLLLQICIHSQTPLKLSKYCKKAQ